jgi:hypothetical protein
MEGMLYPKKRIKQTFVFGLFDPSAKGGILSLLACFPSLRKE